MGVLAISEQKVNGDPVKPIPVPLSIDFEQRRDLIESVRRAIPGIDAVNGLRAVHALAATRSHPDRVKAIHAHLSLASDGTVSAFPKLPGSWEARNHETRVKRSRKGRTTFKRDRLGKARVIGDRYVVTAPYDTDGGLTGDERRAVSADLVALAPSYVHGADALMLTRLTDRRYREHGVPRLIGIEGEAWSTVIPGDPSSRCSVAVHRTDLLGSVVPVHLASYVPLASVYATHTSKSRTARFPISRLRLRKLQARSADPGAVSYVKSDGKPGYKHAPVVGTPRLATASDTARTDGLGYERCLIRTTRYVMPTDRIAVRWCALATTKGHTCDDRCQIHLNTVTPEHLWLGHQLTARPLTTRDARAVTSARVAATTIGTVDRPESLEGWTTLLECVNRNERVKVTYPDGTVRTITRSKSDDGIYSTGSGKDRIQARSADAMALRLT